LIDGAGVAGYWGTMPPEGWMAEVLVVDDSKLMRDMVTVCLRAAPGLAIAHASSGLDAIEQLSLRPFDLLVLDLNMPDIGGIEVLEFVRGQDKLRALPVLVLTTRGDDDSRRDALAAGASSFMTKPFEPDAILKEALALLKATPAEPG
jgi:two-component system chemotaxis response regulator CheY